MTSAYEYLGKPIAEMLSVQPFCGWQAVRTVEYGATPEIWYEFERRGVEVICDEMECVTTVFLHRGGDGEALIGLPFTASRQEVLTRLGRPQKSGTALQVPGLGEKGAWDRFTWKVGVLHVQYAVARDEIDMITLMRTDVVPNGSSE